MTRNGYTRRILLMAGAVLLTSGRAEAQGSGVCAGTPNCTEVSSFGTAVTDFRHSMSGSQRVITVTLRFLNKLDRPLVLGYVQNSGIITDDQGNRYVVYGANAVRGIGEINYNTFDPKFTLAPTERSDARFEFAFNAPQNVILGTTYELDLAIREIDPLPGNQFRLGKEHALHFGGFGSENVAASPPPPAAPAPARGTPASAPVAPAPDPCGALPRCYGAGPFRAEVAQLTTSKASGYFWVRVTLKITNVSTQPMVLAYLAGSGSLIDDAGNRYWNEHNHFDRVNGIGVVTPGKADPQFALRPGESRNATFDNAVSINATLGTVFSYDLTLSQLEILPSQQVRSVREYAVGFRDLTAGAATAAPTAAAETPAAPADNSGKTVLDGLIKKIKRP